YGGTGLGLTISRQLVGLMNGHIKVTSKEESGTCFMFTVGLKISLDHKTVQFDYKERQGGIVSEVSQFDCLVLLVEDNITNQIVAEGMLELFGCEIDLAVNGREAVQMVKEQKYDLILMDCQMPELDGYSATEEIRVFENLTGAVHTPIVALTAHAMSGDRERCISVGMDDYLSKPLRQYQLESVLKQWFSDSNVNTGRATKAKVINEDEKTDTV
ncbi:MAG: response regulator, partial [Desulfocapsa sp.]|nr:response regulator [Desulfocapsa sp.]